MAYIKEVKICGLCGRKEPIQHELKRDLNIIFGVNGSGKTSLLKILHSAMKHQPISTRDAFFENAEIKITSNESDCVKKIDLTEKSINRTSKKLEQYRREKLSLKNQLMNPNGIVVI